ncbi:MAG: mechanosensitive ion channel family protein [Nitrospira sp.]|nr:mechanosensitive ion channel family protein [Nitrospira sp.]MBX3334563.1 mechanosensitive ion channel family protein [Nitrospira sp.]MDR4464862.1 mechanosensitive ion channel family protein [Nitrospira sp.]MDR4466965.1 mechanosensitive ion channel family protein [Nitrospira sp.]
MALDEWFSIDSAVAFDGLKSLLLLLVLLIARTLIVRWLANNPALSMESKRRWVVTTRNSVVFAFLLGLVIIWAHELQAFAVSIVALAAALVLATKELILCWSGAALRVGGKVYTVGDRIQIAGHRGVVLDYDVFATKLLEIGPGQSAHLYTGRVTVFPNSLLFTNPLIKENPQQEYGLYTLTVPIKSEEDWQRSEQALLEAAKHECAPFMDEAVRQMKLLEQANLLEAPSPEPRITIQLPESGKMHLVLRFPAPDRGRSRIEQAILRRYLSHSVRPTLPS